MHLGPHHYSEIIGLLVAVICYYKLRGTFMKWFIPFLAVVLTVELYANYMYYTKAMSTTLLYNICVPLYLTFYTFVFMRLAYDRKHRYTLLVINSLYLLAYCGYTTFFGDWHKFNTNLFVAGSVEMILFSCLYFYQDLRSDYDSQDARYKSGLWIAAGLLIFYSGISICFSLYYYIERYNLQLFGAKLYNIIPRYLSIVLYACLSISFLVWKKQAKS